MGYRTVDLTRRHFLSATGLALSAVPFQALGLRAGTNIRRTTSGFSQDVTAGYGPLQPTQDETTGLPLLHLPTGFRYLSFGWAGDPLNDDSETPGSHDGMAAFPTSNGLTRLIRNHELRSDTSFSNNTVYDPNAGGGTTTIEFDPVRGVTTGAWASLAGTAVNCAGGPTPWGSWLTCEETVAGPGGDNNYQKPHGYIFEVPLEGTATALPLRAMGRFVHEAVAVDPTTGIIYETEDRPLAGLYRFIPAQADRLMLGGKLEILSLTGVPKADLRTDQQVNVWHPVTWLPIDDPDPSSIEVNSIFLQGADSGGATFARLEGAWYGEGRIFIVSTDGGEAAAGQIWEYDPTGNRLRLVFESPSFDVLDMPDNLCVSPRGGLILCEDGSNQSFVRGLTMDGTIFPFAKNNVVLNGEQNGFEGDFREREFAGATFSPDGRWLFFNAQSPGISFAVTGPWARGPL